MRLSTGHHGTAAALAAAVLLGALAGCTGVTTARRPAHRVTGGTAPVGRATGGPAVDIVVPRGTAPRGTAPVGWVGVGTAAGKAAIGAFIARLQARAATPFEAKYLFGTGKVPGATLYAVRLPDDLLFAESPIVGRGFRIVMNGSGEYRCVQRGTGQGQWACQQLSGASAAAQNRDFAIYTAAYWATYLKKLARGAAARISTSTMRADGPPTIMKRARAGEMNCLDFRTAGFGASTICAAAPGILGSVFLCQGSATIPMEWYSTSPPASLFQLPPGATVTRLKAGQA
jgi:hypothetical protein